MALIYVRKIFDHDITHEVSFTQAIHNIFFNGRYRMTFVKGSSSTRYDVTANDATDLRFGGDFKTMLPLPFCQNIGDFVVIEKIEDYYSLRYFTVESSQAQEYNRLLGRNQRHLIFDDGDLIYRR